MTVAAAAQPGHLTGALDLASLVASRMCHDLVSPIGAIGNGVELLGMSGIKGPEMDLVGESVEGASARIRFYRLAFGATEADQTLDGRALGSALADPHRGSRTKVTALIGGTIKRPEAKIACLLLMCLDAALIHGGTVEIAKTKRGWRLTGTGSGLRAEPDLWSHLTRGTGAPVSAGQVQFAIAAHEAGKHGHVIAVDMAPERISVAF